MRRHGVHAHGGVAQQRAAVVCKTLCIHGHQRVGVAFALQLQRPQAVAQLGLHRSGEGLRALGHQRTCVGSARRDHHRAQRMPLLGVIGQGQHRQRAFIAKTLVRHAAMGLGMAHAANDHGAAKVRHACANAQLPPRGREATVRRHQQRGLQTLWRWRRAIAGGTGGSLGQVLQLGMGGLRGHAHHLGAGHDADTRCACRHGIGRAAQCVVGHDEAQSLQPRTLGAQLQGAALAQRAVVHLRFADGAHLVWRQAGPGA